MGNSPSSEWLCKFNEIKSNHDKAFYVIAEGLTLDENSNAMEAIEKYKEGLNLIDSALNVRVSMPETGDNYWEEALRMIQKMKKTRKELQDRIQSIHGVYLAYNEDNRDNLHITQKGLLNYYAELSKMILDFCVKIKDYDSEIIYTYLQVKLYFVSSDGIVKQTSKCQKLVIAVMEENGEQNKLEYFIQIGAYIFPLFDGICPCYRTAYGAFILPDVNAENQETPCIGFALEDSSDCVGSELLENVFQTLTNAESRNNTAKIKEIASTHVFQTIHKNLETYGNTLDKSLMEEKVDIVELESNDLANAFFSTEENIFGTLYDLVYITPEEMILKHSQDTNIVKEKSYKDFNQNTTKKCYPDLPDPDDLE